MEPTTDQSYGVVPVTKRDGEWYVLLIHQISYRGDNDKFWTFPKGHQEGDETPIETAKRELLEETGLSDVQIVEEAKFSIYYSFQHEGKQINKTVSYFLGVCVDTTPSISQPHEIADISWFRFDEAMAKLSHKNTQDVLLATGQFITSHADTI